MPSTSRRCRSRRPHSCPRRASSRARRAGSSAGEGSARLPGTVVAGASVRSFSVRTRSRFSPRSAPTKFATNSSAGCGKQLVCGGHLDEVPVAHDRDAIAHLDRLVDVVGDEDHRLAHLPVQAQEVVLQALSRDRIDGAERLVHEHDRRIGGHRPGHADPLLLAARELARVALEVGRRIEPDQVEQLRRAARGSAAWTSRAAAGPSRCCPRSSCAGTGRSAERRSRCHAAAGSARALARSGRRS